MNEPTRAERFAEAYLEMSKHARYRPAAPSDGLGHVVLSEDELRDASRLMREAKKYAIDFLEADDSRQHNIGCSNYSTNRAFVYVIEASRALCGGSDDLALDLLKMATDEIKRHKR